MNLYMHDQNKEKRRLTWVDWMLILLSLALICFGAWFLLRRYRAATPTVEIRYLICVKGVDVDDGTGAWERLIPIGARITSSNGTAELGRVTAIALQPHLVASAKNGKVVFLDHPQKTDLLITVNARATDGGADGIRVRDIRVAAGEVWDLRVGDYYATGADLVWVSTEGDV